MTFRDEWQKPEFAREWDQSLPRTNPIRDEHLEIIVDAIAAGWTRGDHILDIGIGSGQVEEVLLRRLPHAQVLGLDNSQAMMDLARKRLRPFEGRWKLLEHDLGSGSHSDIQPGSFRYIVCSQVLHEIPNAAKQSVLSSAGRALAENGLFLLADRSKMEDDHFFDAYAAVWKQWKSKRPETLGDSFADFLAHYQEKDDHTASLEAHVAWVEEAGLKATPLHLQLNRFLLAVEHRR